jgi:hypothetical protein
LMAFKKIHPDFGNKGIFFLNMDTGKSTFSGEGTLEERFRYLLDQGFELGTHTWGHVDFKIKNTSNDIQKALAQNEKRIVEILPDYKFFALALPYGERPKDESLYNFFGKGSFEGTEYENQAVMAVGANPSVPSTHIKFNPLYVARIRAQGKVAAEADLTWWLDKMTPENLYVSDGDAKTIVIPSSQDKLVNMDKLGDKKLITY